MTAPIRIRAKNGEVRDLELVRQLHDAYCGNTCRLASRFGGCDLLLVLDALEAMLSVLCPTNEQIEAAMQFDQREADCLRAKREMWFAVRRAAGVIEEGGA